MRMPRIRQTCKRVALQAIGTTLENEKLGREFFEMCFNLWPDIAKFTVSRASSQRKIQLGSNGFPSTCLVRESGPRIQCARILMDVGDDHIGIGFEGIERPVAKVDVDVDSLTGLPA